MGSFEMLLAGLKDPKSTYDMPPREPDRRDATDLLETDHISISSPFMCVDRWNTGVIYIFALRNYS